MTSFSENVAPCFNTVFTCNCNILERLVVLLLILQIDSEAGKKVAANLKSIEGDLQQMRNENSQLAAQLKS